MSFEIGDIFNQVWGVFPAYKVPGVPSLHELMPSKGFAPEVKELGSMAHYDAGEIMTSPLGTDVLFSFKLGGENLRYFDEKTGELKYGSGADSEVFEVPLATIADFSRSKDIVRTKMAGAFGTVKELYSFGDWHIKIRGLLFDENKVGRTAVELRRKLLAFERFADSIPVSGWLFKQYEVNRIVINSISFKSIEGRPWVIPFELDCDSDNEVDLIIE